MTQAGYPGSDMIPHPAAPLSLLTLKLLDKERRSHITAFNFDEALGCSPARMSCPRRAMPPTIPTARSGPANEACCHDGSPPWPRCCFPTARNSAWISIPSPFGVNPTPPRTTTCPTRGKAAPSILSFVAYEPQSRVLCYSNADLIRAGQAGELMRFVDFWHESIDHDPQWLYFDSKVAPYSELAR